MRLQANLHPIVIDVRMHPLQHGTDNKILLNILKITKAKDISGQMFYTHVIAFIHKNDREVCYVRKMFRKATGTLSSVPK